ncbi:MAG: hypothetical protein IKR73_03540, partial [Oscillospiraceae bacterium]|nr:hypothetical protein [Oscillospiraceae bacterium]
GLVLLTGCKFDPSANDPVSVYGPPSDFYDDADDTAVSGVGSETSVAASEVTSDGFDPADNEPQVEYGPPGMIDEEPEIVIEEEFEEEPVDDEELIDDDDELIDDGDGNG